MRGSAHLLVALALTGCATAGPRFSQEVAASFAHDEMRKLTTVEAEIYYPAQGHDAALNIASRLTTCLSKLRSHAVSQRSRGKLLLYLTSANFNNAYVDGQTGGEPLHAVLPLYATSEGFHFDNLPEQSIGDIGCHELLHYVQFEQVEGFWRWVNLIVGDIFGPQTWLERWFTEGLAQYYEGRVDHHVGRPNSPLYRAELESGLAERKGKVGPGDLSVFQRELYPSSGAYLAGLHFIEFLAQKYGEQKLWELIDLQGSSVLSPFGVALRFKAIYGSSLGALVDEWSHDLESRPHARPRPAGQTVVRAGAGYSVRLAAAPDGTLAVLSVGRDEVPMLRLLSPDGSVRVERYLTRITPDRDYVSASPGQLSGLSFTADSRWLFLMNDDLTSWGDDRAQLWKIDATTGETIEIIQDVGGAGGSVTPDGSGYVFVAMQPGHAELTLLDLRTRERTVLAVSEPGTTFAAPAVSPDGNRIALSRGGPNGFDLLLWERGGEVSQLTRDGKFNYGPRWVDDSRLVFLRDFDGRAQAHLIDLDSGAASLLTQAPFAARDLAPGGGRLAFLNRDGWGWSVDATGLQSKDTVDLSGPPPAPEPVEPAQLTVQSDEPYSGAEKVAIPLLRQPSVVDFGLSCGTGNSDCTLVHSYQLALGGRDRLSFHNWAISAYAAFPSNTASLSASYINETLAPWSLGFGAGYDLFTESYGASLSRRVNQVSGSVDLVRSFWTVPVQLGVSGLARWADDGTWNRFIGPSASFSWVAVDATAYGGVQRALGFSLAANWYAKGLGSRFDLADLSAGAVLAVPLPLLKRQSLVLNLDARTVQGIDGLLQTGGVPRGVDLYSHGGEGGPVPPALILPTRFTLPVRGYEDFGVSSSSAAVATGRWRYPFIIDRGFASLLYLFPSLFFRQVELELFGAAAITDNREHPWLRSAGAGVYVRFAIAGLLPISVYYRVAARFDEHLQPLHSVGFSFE